MPILHVPPIIFLLIRKSLITVNVEMFTKYILSRISPRTLNTRKFDVSENYHHNRTNRINWYMRENVTTRKCLLMLDARKYLHLQ